jgi:prepilin-type N-terminal cleavage/methylation domain-containing protein
MPVRRAITLIEVLVVIIVIGVILAILLPAITGARWAAMRTQCLDHIRQSGIAVLTYAQEHRDTFPLFADTQDDNGLVNGGLRLPYLFQSLHWPLAVGPYLGGERVFPQVLCPGGPLYQEVFRRHDRSGVNAYPPEYVFPSEYFMGSGFVTDPTMWQEGSPGNVPALRRAVRIDEVLFPQSKGLLVEVRIGHIGLSVIGGAPQTSITSPEASGRRFHCFTVGGSGQGVARNRMLPGRGLDGSPGTPVLQTEGGIRGRDFE